MRPWALEYIGMVKDRKAIGLVRRALCWMEPPKRSEYFGQQGEEAVGQLWVHPAYSELLS
jgi:hypothetical protein